MKRWGGIFLLVLLLISTLFFVYKDALWTHHKAYSIYDAVPKNAPVFLEFSNERIFEEEIENREYAAWIRSWDIFQTLFSDQSALDSLKSVLNLPQTSDNRFLASISHTGSGKYHWLFVYDFNEQKPIDIDALSEVFELKNIRLTEYQYSGESIFTIENFIQTGQVVFASLGNLFIVSAQSTLVEESISSLLSESPKTSAYEFQQVHPETQEKQGLTLYLEYSNLGALAPAFFSSTHTPILSGMEQLGAWGRYKINFLENSIAINGQTSYVDSSAHLLSKLSNGYPAQVTFDEVLPNNVAYFNGISSQNIDSYFSPGQLPDAYFAPWVNDQFVFFCLETFDENYMRRSGLLIKTDDLPIAKANLFELSGNSSPVDSFGISPIYRLDNFHSSEVFPHSMIQLHNPYYTFIDNYVLLVNDITTLTSVVQKANEGSTLAKDFNYLECKASHSSKTNYFSYFNPSRFIPATQSILSTSDGSLTNIGRASFEMGNTNHTFFSNGLIHIAKNQPNKTTKLWSAQLDTISTYRPQKVINHNNNTYEIITQDALHQLYLISPGGEILFKVPIEGPVLSPVYQIDYYKNGKLQYVFNTKESIYVVDRLGRLVDNFPLKLPSSTNNGILVVNYDNNRTYRYFIACDNGKIYGYEYDGKPLTGWNPIDKSMPANFQVQHIVDKGKDHLFYASSDGVFSSRNRKGESRFDDVKTDLLLKQPFFFVSQEEQSYFVNGSQGKKATIYTNGDVHLENSTDSVYTHYQYVQEAAADVWYYDKYMEVYAHSGTPQFSYTFPDSIESIQPFYANEKTWFAVQTEGYTHVVDDLGRTHSDFPIPSISDVAIEKIYSTRDKAMLTQTSDGKINCFQVNWE